MLRATAEAAALLLFLRAGLSQHQGSRCGSQAQAGASMTAETLFDYAEGQARKQAGMKLVAEHSPEYFALAYAALENVARRQLVLCADDLTQELRGVARERPHPNLIGPVWQAGVRDQIVQRTKEMKASIDPTKRGRFVPVYFSLIFRSA